MINKLKPKSEFGRNVLTLMSGTTIAQAIPIAISPILTRLYTPEDFGVFALYMSIASLLSVVVTGQYELAIMLPKNSRDALNVFLLSTILTFIMSFAVFIIVFIFNHEITVALNNESISKWLYLIPFSIMTVGLFNSFNYWFNRNKSYRFLANTKIAQSFINSGSSVGFGFLKLNHMGLIVSSFVSQSLTVLFFIKKFDFDNLKYFNRKRAIVLARKYRKFPKITMPHSIFSSFSQNLPVFILTKYFTNTDVGFYSFGNKIVAIPINLVSSAYYQVFFEAFSKERDKLSFYKQKFKQVNIIFLPVFTLLWFVLPDLFAFVFSDRWRIAGEYSQILLPLLYMKFISNLFTTTTYIYYQKQGENFILGILITFLIFVSLMTGVYFDNIKAGLFSMMTTNSLVILYKLFRSYKFVREHGVGSI